MVTFQSQVSLFDDVKETSQIIWLRYSDKLKCLVKFWRQVRLFGYVPETFQIVWLRYKDRSDCLVTFQSQVRLFGDVKETSQSIWLLYRNKLKCLVLDSSYIVQLGYKDKSDCFVTVMETSNQMDQLRSRNSKSNRLITLHYYHYTVNQSIMCLSLAFLTGLLQASLL